MAVSFFIFFGSDLSKIDQTWSKWISHQSKNVTIKSSHIYRKDKNGCFVFDFFGSDLSKMDQTGSNWISQQSKNATIKSCHIYRKGKNDCFVFDFFLDQICPKWIKLDQTWSNWISSPIWKCYYEKLSHLQKG